MSTRNRRRTWVLAGAGLIVCGVLGMLQSAAPGATVLRFIADVVYAVSVLAFAVGASRDASVVARRPLGVIAMSVVALWPLFASVFMRLPIMESSADEAPWLVFGYVALLVPTAAGLVAAMQIARGGVVPSPWRWAPMWVLGLHAVVWAVPQIVFVSVRPETIQSFAEMFFLLGALASLAGTLGLGILAVVLATQRRLQSVEVYRSA